MQKNKLFIVFITFGCLNFIYSQNDTAIHYQDNGVAVHKAQGVEKKSKKQANKRTDDKLKEELIEDWGLERCEKAIREIEAKIEHLKTQEVNGADLQLYIDQLKAIKIRKEKLISNK